MWKGWVESSYTAMIMLTASGLYPVLIYRQSPSSTARLCRIASARTATIGWTKDSWVIRRFSAETLHTIEKDHPNVRTRGAVRQLRENLLLLQRFVMLVMSIARSHREGIRTDSRIIPSYFVADSNMHSVQVLCFLLWDAFSYSLYQKDLFPRWLYYKNHHSYLMSRQQR